MKVSSFQKKKKAQATEAAIWVHQKMVASTGEFLTWWSKLSKIHFSLPSASTEVHQRGPTSSRPLTFLTVQKSQHSSTVTKMKIVTSPTPKSPKVR